MNTELTDISIDFQNALKKLDIKSQCNFINDSFIESVMNYDFTTLKYLLKNNNSNLFRSQILCALNHLRSSDNKKTRELIINQRYGTTKEPILFIAIEEDSLENVKYLLEECKVDINGCDSNNDSALHRAVEKKNIPIISYLVKVNTINPLLKNNNHKTPLDLAIQNNEIHIINILNNEYQKKHLCFLMLKTKDIALLKKLIAEKHYDLDYEDNSGNTLLHEAVKTNNIEAIKYLINLPKIKVLKKNSDGKTPFDLAREDNNKKAITLMAKNKYSKEKYSLLILATIYSDTPLTNYLIKENLANIDDDDEGNNNAIHHAVLNNEIYILSLLLKIPNANPLKFNRDSETALCIAEKEKNNEALDIIINAQYVDKDHGELSIIHIAIKNQQLDLLKHLIETKKIRSNSTNKSKNLIIASHQNNPEIIEYLKKTENAEYSASQQLPLNISAKHGLAENCLTILKYFPQTINLKNHHNKQTALMEAIYNNHLDVLEILLKQSKIEINKTCALHAAIHMKNKLIVKRLIDHSKTNIFKKNSQQNTVFDIAAKQNIIKNTAINEALAKKQNSIQKNSLLFITNIIFGFLLLSSNVKEFIENSKYNKNAIIKKILTVLIILALISACTIHYIEAKKGIQRTVKTIFFQNLNLILDKKKKESCSSDDHNSSFENVSIYSNVSSNVSRQDSTDHQARRNSSIIKPEQLYRLLSQKFKVSHENAH